MTKTEKVLQEFGLSKNETIVYLVTLKQERLTPFQIHKITGIARTTVYDTLLSLSLKQLIELDQSDGYKKQQTLVTAKNPSTLRSIIKKNKKSLDELEIDILDILPELTNSYGNYKTNTDFSYYEGIKGFKKIYFNRDIIPEIAWNPLISSNYSTRKKHRTLIDKYSKTISSSKNPHKELIPWNSWTQHVISAQHERNSKYLNRNFRYIENSSFDIHTYISLTKDRIAIACAKDDEAWGMIIKSHALYQTLKATFEMLWITATPVTKDIVNKLGANDLYKAAKRKGHKDL